jgi:hypothetical protein
MSCGSVWFVSHVTVCIQCALGLVHVAKHVRPVLQIHTHLVLEKLEVSKKPSSSVQIELTLITLKHMFSTYLLDEQ